MKKTIKRPTEEELQQLSNHMRQLKGLEFLKFLKKRFRHYWRYKECYDEWAREDEEIYQRKLQESLLKEENK